MRITSEVTERGVTERGFELDVAGERLPGIVWSPDGANTPRPVVLIGHGGTQHKRDEGVLARARRLVRHHGYATVAIDAPGHGDRATPAEAAAARATIQARIAGQAPAWDAARMRQMAERTARAVPEWTATLDVVQQLPYIGDGPVGYWGVSMGTSIGAPFLAGEPRVRCAVLGLNGLRQGDTAFEQVAKRITIPILFIFQWNDELVTRDAGIALFDAFGAKEKTMHINPGGHVQMPAFEREDYERFFLRHLGPASS